MDLGSLLMYEYAQKKARESSHRFLKENQVSSESLAILHGERMYTWVCHDSYALQKKMGKGQKENPSKLQGISLFHLL